MAFPKDIKDIEANFPEWKLKQVINALKNDEVKWLEGGGLTAAARSRYFEYEGHKFYVLEILETVHQIKMIAKGKPITPIKINMANYAESAVVEAKLHKNEEEVHKILSDMFQTELKNLKRILESVIDDIDDQIEENNKVTKMRDWVTK